MSTRSIFRASALERLQAPEELDRLLQVTTPKGWLALIGLCSLLIVAVVWGVLATVTTTVGAQGALVPEGGIVSVVAMAQGRVQRIEVEAGDRVRAGQVVASLSGVGGGVLVRAPMAGVVIGLLAGQGDLVAQGSPVLNLAPPARTLEAVLYVPFDQASELRPGMDVQVAPATVPAQEYGFVRGSVRSIGAYPATSLGMTRTLGSDELARSLAQGGALIEVHVALASRSRTASGYAWTLGKGPPRSLAGGIPCTARIVISRQPMIGLGN